MASHFPGRETDSVIYWSIALDHPSTELLSSRWRGCSDFVPAEESGIVMKDGVIFCIVASKGGLHICDNVALHCLTPVYERIYLGFLPANGRER